MQPTIICAAPVPGLIYLNGRFAGEASFSRPLIAPVAPGGPVYLEYRPLEGTGVPLARRIVLSGGSPMADSLERAEGLSCVAWPSGALEIEFTLLPQTSDAFMLEGIPCSMRRADSSVLNLGGLEIDLPEGALRPALLRLSDAAALLGGLEDGGQYLAALNADLSACVGLLIADRVDFASGGMVNASLSLGDSVGHGRLEQWLLDGNGLNRVSSEPTWTSGSPRWPASPEAALLAAVEAVLAGLPEEADGYLSPALAASRPLDAIADICDGCAPMKYGIPDGRPCAGLVRVENDHLATVRPLYCRAEGSGGPQGPWKITSIEAE